MAEGWFKLYRKLSESKLWLGESFTRGQAWVDLIMLANHEDGWIRKRGIKVEVKRGEVGWSEKSLAKRWKWSRGKVRRFISELCDDAMLRRPSNHNIEYSFENDQKMVHQTEHQNWNVTSVFSIINYEKYQGHDTPNGTGDGHQTDTKRYQNKNDKNDKNVKELRKGNGQAVSLPDWIPVETWKAYLEMRTRIRKTATENAKSLIIKKLEQLKTEGQDPKAVLEQSIMNSWQGVFPLKEGYAIDESGRTTKEKWGL